MVLKILWSFHYVVVSKVGRTISVLAAKILKGNRVQTVSLHFSTCSIHVRLCFIAFYGYICMQMCILVILLLPYCLYSYCVVFYFILYTPILALSQSTHFIYDRQRNINCIARTCYVADSWMKAQNRSGNNKACEFFRIACRSFLFSHLNGFEL